MTCTGLVNAFGGCTIGGSSAINAGLFFEPPASDYDLYYPIGWKSADVKNATKRLYDMQPSTNLTSQDGIRYLQSGYNVAKQWIVDSLGFENIDINGLADNKTQVFGFPIFDYNDGQRGGPVTNYLQDALTRSNFHMQTGALVQRVERDGSNATGVTLSIDGVQKTVNGGRVILSGGALRSPALLMFSGIGPQDDLERLEAAGKLNVPIDSWVNSSSVGAQLFDNPNTFIQLQSQEIESYTYSYETSPGDLYLQERSGPYTFASETSVFWDTLTHPDGSIAGFQGTIDSSGSGDFNGNDVMTLNVYGTSGMKSTGNVVLDQSFIPGPDGNVYYSHSEDAEDISRFIFKIFQALPASLTPLNIPRNSTEQEIQQYITSNVGEVNHWSSSCRMGSCISNQTVVSGMDNLHVVDGSIVPPLTVNPQFGIMVAAEKASEIILGEWYQKSI